MTFIDKLLFIITLLTIMSLMDTLPTLTQNKLSRWNLFEKHIVVTGGTKGIGKAIVEECCQLGIMITKYII